MKSNTTKLVVILISLAFSFQLMYQPLPDDFEQPWKYRLICFGAEISNIFVSFYNIIYFQNVKNMIKILYN